MDKTIKAKIEAIKQGIKKVFVKCPYCSCWQRVTVSCSAISICDNCGIDFKEKKQVIKLQGVIKLENKYLEKYLEKLSSTQSREEKLIILDKLYHDGFEDGVNAEVC